MRICTVVGARPQFVKASAVSPALKAVGIEEVLIHTGQHYDALLSQVFFDELGVPAPDENLNVGSGSHAHQTGAIMERLEAYLTSAGSFDAVLVYGDTNSTLAGALVAAKCHVPVAHVEAGIRSFNRRMPEEINRVITDALSKWLFAPTDLAVQHLAAEGLTKGTVMVGDVMLDATRMFTQRAKERWPLERITSVPAREYAIATVHRPSNTDTPGNLASILSAFGRLPWPVLLPLHPRTKAAMGEMKAPGNVVLMEPVGYLAMLTLCSNARLVLTDSGGLQKEAYWMQVPCVTLRTETEYPETFANGWNTCTAANEESIVAAAAKRPNGPQHALGQGPRGSAARMIAELLHEDCD